MRSGLLMVILATTLFSATAVTCYAQDQEPIETIQDVSGQARLALVNAAEARRAERYDEAVTILQNIVDNHPKLDHFLVRFHLGNSLELVDRTADAAVQFEAAVTLEPRHAPSWLSLGQSAFDSGNYSLAAKSLEQAFRIDEEPETLWLYYAGVAHLQGDDPLEAASVLREVCTIADTRPELDWFRAWIAAESLAGRREQGDQAVATMLIHHPDDPRAWALHSQHALQYEDYRTAAVALTVQDYLAPLAADDRTRLGDILSAAGTPAWAARQYREALGQEPSSEDYVRLARAHLAAHADDDALAVINEALGLAPSFELWNMKGYVSYEREEFEAAMTAFGECLDLKPDFGRAHTLMGYCALELGRFGEARVALELALKFDDELETAQGLLRDLRRRVAE
jgi:tetratricopeptide (TPR) repeat protein